MFGINILMKNFLWNIMPLGLTQMTTEGIIEGLAGGDDDIYDWFDKQKQN